LSADARTVLHSELLNPAIPIFKTQAAHNLVTHLGHLCSIAASISSHPILE